MVRGEGWIRGKDEWTKCNGTREDVDLEVERLAAK